MNTLLTDDTKAIILLCGILGKDRAVNPLSLAEYNTLARWLISEKMRPKDLLIQQNLDVAATGSGINQARLKSLLGRGVQLGFAVEEWQRNGIWIISRSDKDYPERYKKHLKDKAPPLLFGAGDRTLLQGGGVAIVGSRNVDAEGELFAREAAKLCASNKMPVVSGGARGVDQIAMTAALDAGGNAIGILAENLLKKSLERHSRNAIAAGRLLLISPYHPNARFTVGTAMGRNKLIYALANYGLVVSAEYKKGGTWAGAEEELKRDNHLMVFVRPGAIAPDGNKRLLEIGAVEWPATASRNNLNQQLADLASKRIEPAKQEIMNLFDFIEPPAASPCDEDKKTDEAEIPPAKIKTDEISSSNLGKAIYDAVLPVILNQLGSPITADELSKLLNVSKLQLNSWLTKAVEEGKIRKLSRPDRFCLKEIN